MVGRFEAKAIADAKKLQIVRRLILGKTVEEDVWRISTPPWLEKRAARHISETRCFQKTISSKRML